MQLAALGPLPLTLIASLVLAVVLLAIRIFVMQRVQQKRQRENRQETERLKSLVAAYRSLAGSFTPAMQDHTPQLEETLADIILFGSLTQVELSVSCANALKNDETVDFQPLIKSLRSDLRTQLGLEQIPSSLIMPASGPARLPHSTRGEGDGDSRGNNARGGGGSGGGGGAAVGVGGLSAGIIAADVSTPK
ncbi:MAG: preprotein translocase subunit YajC [Pseudomonadota bacterium]